MQAMQAKAEHPLHSFGYRKPPHWLWRMSPRSFVFVAAVKDIWLIATGRLTLHRAWQHGYDDHSRESMRAALARRLTP